MIRLICTAFILVCVGALAVMAGNSPRWWIIAASLGTVAVGVLWSVWLDLTRVTVTPIPMILLCPACGLQHVDAPWNRNCVPSDLDNPPTRWENPPHRSHLCHGCGFIWRPADVPTCGVESITTAGVADSIKPGLLHEYAQVGIAMVNITTTVREPDEWGAIPELWLDCMRERDRLRIQSAVPPVWPAP